jgi:hypothetical protein
VRCGYCFVPDTWTLKEIALFEAGMCNFGKDFHNVQKVVRTKTTNEIVDFYYQWKKSAHGNQWCVVGVLSVSDTPPRVSGYVTTLAMGQIKVGGAERQREVGMGDSSPLMQYCLVQSSLCGG